MKFIRPFALLFLAFAASCSSTPTRDPFDLHLPGPTLAQRVPGGYELKNRHVRVVIDDKTGDVVFWGLPDGTKNLLGSAPIRFAVSGNHAATFTAAISAGYVEPRDDQTWQYMGDDPVNRLSWRKIYCLDGEHLNISVLIQNLRPESADFVFGLQAPFAASNCATDAEHFTSRCDQGVVHFHGYNEHHDIPAAAGSILVSDEHALKSGERISWTMQWTCELGK